MLSFTQRLQGLKYGSNAELNVETTVTVETNILMPKNKTYKLEIQKAYLICSVNVSKVLSSVYTE